MTVATVGMARSWARCLHTGQSRIGGDTYITHVSRVAALVEAAGGDEEQVQAAWLHDVVEDTPCMLGHLRVAGFSDRVMGMVDALSRREPSCTFLHPTAGGESYWEYLDRLKSNRCAVLVKWADLLDNAFDDVTRRGMWPRYEKAMRLLGAPWFDSLAEDNDSQREGGE